MKQKIILPDKNQYPTGLSHQAQGIESCANAYFETHPIIKRIFINRLKKAVSLIPSNKRYLRILDLGTGIGALLPTLSNLYNDSNIIGADYSPVIHATKGMIEKSQIDNVELARCDMRNMPFNTHSFDLIICLSVLEHFEPIRDLPNVFKEIKRLLSEDGIFIAGWPCEATFLNIMLKFDATFLRPNVYKLRKESFDKGETSEHLSDYVNLRKNLRNNFRMLDYEAIPHKYGFRFFRIYEIYACTKF
jgi:ubiquinone/menaquinone biosynthesis C-methylase UbiE